MQTRVCHVESRTGRCWEGSVSGGVSHRSVWGESGSEIVPSPLAAPLSPPSTPDPSLEPFREPPSNHGFSPPSSSPRPCPEPSFEPPSNPPPRPPSNLLRAFPRALLPELSFEPSLEPISYYKSQRLHHKQAETLTAKAIFAKRADSCTTGVDAFTTWADTCTTKANCCCGTVGGSSTKAKLTNTYKEKYSW